MKQVNARIGKDRALLIPNEYCKQMGRAAAEEVMLQLQDGSIRVVNIRRAVKHAQKILRQYAPEDRALADELIAERE